MQACTDAGWNCSCICLEGGGGDSGVPDAGQPDAGEPDAGEPDAGEPDAGELDAGELDAGAPDAGEPDAGAPDAGEPDAGEPDAGEPDAGEPDAGEPDAGEGDGGARDAGSGDGGVCARVQLGDSPVDMFIMLDQSGSMGADCNVGSTTNSKWCNVINGLSSYFKSASATGNAAALQYFALSSPIACNGTGYDVSAVPGGNGYVTLPSAAFDSNLNAHTPSTNTPHEPAIRGIMGFTSRAINRRAGRTTVGVFITDGDPCCGECNENITTLSGLLSNHATSTGIPTYVVGMTGANFTNLESYAVAGRGFVHADTVGGVADTCGNGAGPCRHWNVGSGSGTVVREMLRLIQRGSAGCGRVLPTDAGFDDPSRVSLAYFPNGQPQAQALTQINDAGMCGADSWYFPSSSGTGMAMLCPSLCSTVAADVNARIEASAGCP